MNLNNPNIREQIRLDKIKDKRLYKTYGIHIDYWQALLESQGGGCAICKRKDGRLCVDHIHQKGYKKMPPEEKIKYVRGILCFLCNTGLKGFERTSDGGRNRRSLIGTFEYFQVHCLKGEI